MPELTDLGEDQRCLRGDVKLVQPGCPDQAFSHSSSLERCEEMQVQVGKPEHVMQGWMDVSSLEPCCGISLGGLWVN